MKISHFRCGFYKFAILCQHLLCLIERENYQPGQDFRTDPMKREFELGDNRKVTSAASNCPKQVGVFVLAGSDPPAVGGDHVDRDQIVDGHAIFACQPTESAAQCQTRDPGG
jgi:hypothetical protein